MSDQVTPFHNWRGVPALPLDRYAHRSAAREITHFHPFEIEAIAARAVPELREQLFRAERERTASREAAR